MVFSKSKVFCVFVLCVLLIFVIWQTRKCFVKYLKDESDIIVSNWHIWDLEDETLPALTICPNQAEAYNKTKLMEYGISSQVKL